MNKILLTILAALLIGACSSAPKYRTIPADTSPRPSDRDMIVEIAKSYVGTPYRSGGTTRQGVDCSGLIVAVYRDFDILLPRASFRQARVGKRIERSDLEPGDLIFFKTKRGASITHVGIYIGRNQFIHTSTRKRRVTVDRLNDTYFRRRFITARRIVE
ncbi:MAG: NlpC/P60 family protein [Candidatus Latescibacteria bacterium]|nr:NlpC/P60 family protein [Candidatus Latescibacterota bacterium]NIM21787.1 NlpC/P60 family protein [Candidatus Latescibacterota bacterium]NIM65925.1 NlpC/P60 family protein [Candidatus Latescibacterota bacterium]NIO02670.1 NlpC/P60 family protein [Candidatus Latescibacterota bacterium]NIO29651.1 NlpC/P60 family protein [Candidatus Latescibacterota bacterium]